MTTPEQMDWNNLGFGYTDTGKRYFCDTPYGWCAVLQKMPPLPWVKLQRFTLWLNMFEGLKAYRTKSGEINLFRVDRGGAVLLSVSDAGSTRGIGLLKQLKKW